MSSPCMALRSFFLALILLTGINSHAQQSLPSPEAFVNAVFHTVVDSSLSRYYLLGGTDTCRFVKYDYDEWVKYSLWEEVPLMVMNELAEKVFLSHAPYYWKADSLQNATCITALKADSLLAWPKSVPGVFSFSRPYFTADGSYAVIDLNFVCGFGCGKGTTFLFHWTAGRWKLIGRHVNWTS